MKLIYDGKTKRVFRRGRFLVFRFKDTVLGHSPGKPDPGGNRVIGRLPGKAELATATAVFFFKLLHGHGIRTHFIRQLSPTDIEVFKTEPIPLEVIYRKSAYGSFLRRYRGFVKPFCKLDMVEFTLKSDELGDPLITRSAIERLRIATQKELQNMEQTTRRAARVLATALADRGLELVDFKLEFGRYAKRLIVIDALNADSMRVADKRRRILGHRELARRLGVSK